jgi:hypothetical protein
MSKLPFTFAANAMRVPSRDQAGVRIGVCRYVKRWTPLPSRFIRYRSGLPSSRLLRKTICPAGPGLGAPRATGATTATRAASRISSALISASSLFLPRST